MANPQVSLDITASDKTKVGFDSAEKRAKQLGKSTANALKPVEKIGSSSATKGFLRSLVDIEKAGAHAFGAHSLIRLNRHAHAFGELGQAIGSGFGRMSVAANDSAEAIGGVATAGEGAGLSLGKLAAGGLAAGVGLEGAGAAGTALVATLGPIAVVGAAAIGTLVAGGLAGYKFASGWAAAAASLGRLSETIGVTSRDMQTLQGAGERYGIDKNSTAGAVASFATTINDARYGRNNNAIALMSKLGVKFKYGKDGNLDDHAMMLDFADAEKRQTNPQTQLMIARQFGFEAMLPMMRKGSAAMRADEADVGKHGVVNTDTDIANAQLFQRNSVRIGQLAGRKLAQKKAWVAGKYAPAMGTLADIATGQFKASDKAAITKTAASVAVGVAGAAVAGPAGAVFAHTVVDNFVPAAKKIGEAADKMLAAVSGVGAGATAPGGRMGQRSISSRGTSSLADRIEHLGERSRQGQVSPKGAIGVMQIMPGTAREQAARMGIPFDEHRYKTDANYNRMLGRGYVDYLSRRYNGDEALVSAAYNAGPGAVDKWIGKFGDPRTGRISDAEWISHIPGHGKHSYEETRRYAERVTHHHEIHVHDNRVVVKTKSPGQTTPAISMAMI